MNCTWNLIFWISCLERASGVLRGVRSEIRLGLDHTLLRLLCVGTAPCNSVFTVVMMEVSSSPRPWTFPTAVTNHVCETRTKQIIIQPLRHRARITQSVQHQAFNLSVQGSSPFSGENILYPSDRKRYRCFFFKYFPVSEAYFFNNMYRWLLPWGKSGRGVKLMTPV